MSQHIAGTIGPNRNRANAAFMVGLFTILGALAFEHIGGYEPCELCLVQRVPYYVGLPLLGVLLFAWHRLPVPGRLLLTVGIMLIFIWSAGLGVHHAGVEWGFWPGPASCSGLGGGVSFDQLSDINAARVVPCDRPAWTFLGISFAGYNALISLLMAGLLGWSARGQFRRLRPGAGDI